MTQHLDLGVGLGLGAEAGVYLRTPADRAKLRLFVDATRFVAGDTTTRLRTGTEQRLTLTRNLAVVVTSTYNRIEGRGWFEGSLGLDLFF